MTLLALAGITSISCQNDINEEAQPTAETSKSFKGINPVVSLPSKYLNYDEVSVGGKKIANTQKQLL